jgi:hypothetical protein
MCAGVIDYNMKRLLLVLTLGAALASPAFAQSDDSTNAPPPGPPGGHHGMLTKEEWQELKSAHDAALQANPALGTEGEQLKSQMEAFHQKMNAAMIKADPSVEPILQKMEAEHHQGGPGPDGPPPGQ